MVDGEWTKVVNDHLGYQLPTLSYIHIKGNIIYHFPYFEKKRESTSIYNNSIHILQICNTKVLRVNLLQASNIERKMFGKFKDRLIIWYN